MHENRETSRTPRTNQERDRSAKVRNYNAGTHVLEESDCAVVPVNQPNKGGQPSAEVGEGRARTKENIAQSNTSPTQSGERVSQGLRGVRQVAKARKQERFTALLHHLTVALLRDSFYALKRQAAPGVDGVSGRSMKLAWRIGWPICTAGCIVERIGQNPRGESIFRRLTDDNAR